MARLDRNGRSRATERVKDCPEQYSKEQDPHAEGQIQRAFITIVFAGIAGHDPNSMRNAFPAAVKLWNIVLKALKVEPLSPFVCQHIDWCL